MLISDTTNTKHYFSWSKPEPGVIDPSSQAILFPTNHLDLPPMTTYGSSAPPAYQAVPSRPTDQIHQRWRGGREAVWCDTCAHGMRGSSTHREHRSRCVDVHTSVEFCFSVVQKNVCCSRFAIEPLLFSWFSLFSSIFSFHSLSSLPFIFHSFTSCCIFVWEAK